MVVQSALFHTALVLVATGALTGLYPTVVIALQVWCLSLTTGPGTCSSQLYHRQYPVYCSGGSFDLRHRWDTILFKLKNEHTCNMQNPL